MTPNLSAKTPPKSSDNSRTNPTTEWFQKAAIEGGELFKKRAAEGQQVIADADALFEKRAREAADFFDKL